MIAVTDLHVSFGRAHILQGISTVIGDKPFGIVGRNGMGKSTFCHALMGMAPVSRGSVLLDGGPITRLPPNRIARRGLALVPQGRRVFPSLRVDEHLRLVSQGAQAVWTLDRVYETFPRLAERKSNYGTQLSGGEQQMLAIARALLMNPRHVIMDEPSEGLAPVIVDRLIEVLRSLAHDGIGLILVEQNLRVATEVCEQVSIMVTGQIVLTVSSADIASDPGLRRQHLGVGTIAPAS